MNEQEKQNLGKNDENNEGINKEGKTQPLERISSSTINENKKVEDSGNKGKLKKGGQGVVLKSGASERKAKVGKLKKELLKAARTLASKLNILRDKLNGK